MPDETNGRVTTRELMVAINEMRAEMRAEAEEMRQFIGALKSDADQVRSLMQADIDRIETRQWAAYGVSGMLAAIGSTIAAYIGTKR